MKRIINRKNIVASGSIISIFAIIASPAIAAAVSQTASTTINATIAQSISISSSGTVSVSITPTGGGVESSNSDTVTVSTNDTAGYALTLADNDTNTNLVSGGNNVAASANTYAAPATLGSNTWGYATAGGNFSATYSAESNVSGSALKWAGMPSSASPQQLKSTSTTASGDTTTVWYGVKATSAQPAGTYSDTVTYTATGN